LSSITGQVEGIAGTSRARPSSEYKRNDGGHGGEDGGFAQLGADIA
jgi:hypothetical protein